MQAPNISVSFDRVVVGRLGSSLLNSFSHTENRNKGRKEQRRQLLGDLRNCFDDRLVMFAVMFLFFFVQLTCHPIIKGETCATVLTFDKDKITVAM